jgi:hypothetical protein
MKQWLTDGHNMFWFREDAKGEKKTWVELVFTATEVKYILSPGGHVEKTMELESYRFCCPAEDAVKALRDRADAIEEQMADPETQNPGVD